jgi:hypothetical protein
VTLRKNAAIKKVTEYHKLKSETSFPDLEFLNPYLLNRFTCVVYSSREILHITGI